MSSPSTPHDELATPEEWATYRDVITHLYEHQNMRLKEVRQFMQREYGFIGTPKMYKYRFQKWGLRKNLGFTLYSELLRQQKDRAAVGKPSQALVRGRKIESTRLQTYLRQLPREKLSQLSGPSGESKLSKPAATLVSCRTPSPSPDISCLFGLSLPDGTQEIEQCFHILKVYMAGVSENGSWPTHSQFDSWSMQMSMATSLFQLGQLRHGFRVLEICFRQYKDMLKLNDPRLLVRIYGMLYVMSQDHPDICKCFITYTERLLSIIHGGSHPLREFVGKLQQFSPSQVVQNRPPLLECYLDLTKRYLTPGGRATLNLVTTMDSSITAHHLIHSTTNGHHLDSLVHGRRYPDFIAGTPKSSFINEIQALGHWLRGDVRAAWTALALSSGTTGQEQNSEPTWFLYQLSFAIFYSHGDIDQAMTLIQETIQRCRTLFGSGDCQTASALVLLESILRRIGNVEGADNAHRQFEAEMDIFYGNHGFTSSDA